MSKRMIAAGKVKGTKRPVWWCIVDEEARAVVARVESQKAAEAWIAEQEKVEPVKVKRGGYGIDGPCR